MYTQTPASRKGRKSEDAERMAGDILIRGFSNQTDVYETNNNIMFISYQLSLKQAIVEV